MLARKYKQLRYTKLLLVSSLLVFIVSAFLVRDNHISGLEKWVFRAIYDLPGWLDHPFLWITQAGSVYALCLLAITALLWRKYHIFWRLLVTGTAAYFLAFLAKELVGRERPLTLISDVVYRDYLVHGPGFPSGHTALVTAIALTVGLYMPRRYKWLPTVTIVLVALSRIYLGVHAPLDVVGGFAIGLFSFALFRDATLKDIHKYLQKNHKRLEKAQPED